jgi:hypothetical protein
VRIAILRNFLDWINRIASEQAFLCTVGGGCAACPEFKRSFASNYSRKAGGSSWIVTNRRLSGMASYRAICPDVGLSFKEFGACIFISRDLEWGTLTGVHVPGHDQDARVVRFWQNPRLTHGNGPGPAGN